MKAYIVEYGEVVSTAKFAGNFEDMWDAKKALIHDMSDGDKIALIGLMMILRLSGTETGSYGVGFDMTIFFEGFYSPSFLAIDRLKRL